MLFRSNVIDIMTDKTASAKELAERHGINLGQIYKMHKGLIWKHITCDPKYTPRNFIQEKRKIPYEVALAIKSNIPVDYEATGKKYGVNPKTLKRLRNPRYFDSWKTIPLVEGNERKCNARVKLTDKQVLEIVNDHKTHVKELAYRYRVSAKMIYRIYKGKAYEHITSHIENKRNLMDQHRKIPVDVVRKIRSGEIKELELVAKAYNVTMGHLKKLRQPNSNACHKYIPLTVGIQ